MTKFNAQISQAFDVMTLATHKSRTVTASLAADIKKFYPQDRNKSLREARLEWTLDSGGSMEWFPSQKLAVPFAGMAEIRNRARERGGGKQRTVTARNNQEWERGKGEKGIGLE